MKQILNLFIFLLVFLSCADEFVAENPIDPDNPDYIPPIVSFVSGPDPGETIYAENTVITFSGNESSMLYRSQLDSSDWSGWISAQSITLDYLDEGEHIFSLQGKYTTGDTSAVISIPFAVDAVAGPALLFSPRRHTAAIGQMVTYQILAEEVYELAGTEFILDYNPSKLEIEAIRQGELFSSFGTPIFFSQNDPATGKLTITSSAWAGTDQGFTGTGVIIEIDVVLTQSGNSTINFNGNEVLRNPNNITINISEAIGGFITNP